MKKPKSLSIMPHRLKELRDINNVSQIAFAMQFGVSRNSVGLYESGMRTPDAGLVFDICRHFNVSADWLLGLTDVMSRDITDLDTDTAVYVIILHNSEYAIMIENWLINYQIKYGKGIHNHNIASNTSCGTGVYAFNEDKLVGGLTFHIHNDWIFLNCGYILPEYRGQKIYSKFLHEIEKLAIRSKLSGMFVSTYTFEAPHIYEHFGFVKGSVLKDMPKGNTNIDYYKKL